MFGSPAAGYSAKIADFGHATVGYSEDTFVSLPPSKFWSAPDYHPRGFQLQDAKKFDAHSFGLIVYWLLKARHLTEKEIEDLQSDVQVKADQLEVKGLREMENQDLEAFFRLTLTDKHQDRSVDWLILLSSLGGQPSEELIEEFISAESARAKGVVKLMNLASISAEQEAHPKLKVRTETF